MGLYSGSMAICRYRVCGGDPAAIPTSEWSRRLAAHQASKLRLEGVKKELLAGWVRPPLDPELAVAEDEPWDLMDCQLGDGFVLRLRIEKRQVPTSLLKLAFREEVAAEERKSEGKPLGRRRRKELLEQVKQELMSRALPHVSYVDAFWRERQGVVVVFTTSKTQQKVFEELFKRTFTEPQGLLLFKIAPPLLGLKDHEWRLGAAGDARLGRLAETVPSVALLSGGLPEEAGLG